MAYTKEEHVFRLLMMLDTKHPCNICPGGMCGNFIPALNRCQMCVSFVGINPSVEGADCPCNYYGEQEAIKRTWLALESGGYLENCEV